MAHHRLVPHPLVVRQLSVTAVTDPSPRLRRITLTGPQLREFERDGLQLPAFAAPGFDDHVKLIFATEGPVTAVLPRQLPHGIEWQPTPLLAGRDYTPRRVDLAASEIDLEFVRHGTGPAAAWADAAEPGSTLWFVGPKSSTELPERIDWVLLAGDETALPAIGRFLDERPVEVPARVVVNVVDESGRIDLALREGDQIHWVVDPDPTCLAAAVREIGWLDGQVYAWAAGESRALLPLRRFLAREKAVPKTHVNVTGYWVADDRSEAADVAAPAATTAAPAAEGAPAVPEPPVTWFATRAAIRLGVIDGLARGGRTIRDLAGETGVDVERLTTLVAVLIESEVLVQTGDTVTLGRLGDLILDDEHVAEAFDGHDAELVLAMADLAEAMPTGRPAWHRRHGRTFHESVHQEAGLARELVEQAERLQYLTAGIANAPVWGRAAADRAEVLLCGPGAAVVAGMLPAGVMANVVAESGIAEALREQAGGRETWGWLSQWQACHLAVVALGMAHRTDEEVVALLAEVRRHTRAVVLIESLEHDGLDPHAAERALLAVTATGAAPRSLAALTHLAHPAGWTVGPAQPIGWGVGLVELTAAR